MRIYLLNSDLSWEILWMMSLKSLKKKTKNNMQSSENDPKTVNWEFILTKENFIVSLLNSYAGITAGHRQFLGLLWIWQKQMCSLKSCPLLFWILSSIYYCSSVCKSLLNVVEKLYTWPAFWKAQVISKFCS